MSLLEAIIIAIVEGITEYLPVSSTGHMIIVGEWLGFTGDKAKTFEVIIQLGSILAVVVMFWRRLFGLIGIHFGGSGGHTLVATVSSTVRCWADKSMGPVCESCMQCAAVNPTPTWPPSYTLHLTCPHPPSPRWGASARTGQMVCPSPLA